MTLKREDGKWCGKKVTAACGIVVTAATVVMAMPEGIRYISKISAPWFSFPDQLNRMEERQTRMEDTQKEMKTKVDAIAGAVGVMVTSHDETNNYAGK